MFNKKGKDFTVEKISTMIGSDAVITGTFEAKDTTRVEGVIHGDIKSEETVIVGTTGKVNGNITAKNVMVAGEVKGNMHVVERIEASASGKIFGDIQAKSLYIDENAVFQGQCTMNVPNNVLSQE